jgi:phosphohistidine phosphatase
LTGKLSKSFYQLNFEDKSMLLYLVRHGIAEEIGATQTPDEKRPLTDDGRKKAARAANGLVSLGCKPECIVSSPLSRAYQTAEIFAKILKYKSAINLRSFLKPGGQIKNAIDFLRQTNCESVMFIGHMPDLSSLASALISPTPSAAIEFKKAGACCISFPGKVIAGKGMLEWLLQPKQLKKIR